MGLNGDLLSSAELVARFRAIRKVRSMSVQNVADRTGIDRAILSNLETGRRTMLTIDEARAIASALEVSLLDCLRPEPVTIIPAVTV